MKIPHKFSRCLAFVFSLLFFYSCNVNKHLKENEYLIQKSEVKNNGTHIDKSDLEAFVRQKPNRKVLKLVRFNLWLYNQVNQEKMLRKKQERNEKYDRINAKRIARTEKKNEQRAARGKTPKSPKLKNKDKLTFRESVLEAGEAPVILDTFLTGITTKQLQRYVFSQGYFDSKVRDSIVVDVKHKRAKVFYSISKSVPYRIHDINYAIEDSSIAYFIYNDTINTLIKRGRRYDEDLLQKERERVSDVQLDNGYYYFAPEYVYYVVDTNLAGPELNLTVGVKKFATSYSETNDSIIYINHPRFTVNKVFIVTENIKENIQNSFFGDTSIYKGVYFLYNGSMHFRQHDIAKQISIAEGQIYQQSLAEDTYKALTGLHVFKSVSIQYFKNSKHPDRLDCYIVCLPVVKQAIAVETEGTNTSGNLGIAGSIVFQNKNLFGGAELIELKLKGSITAQKQFNNTQTGLNNIQSTFNTYQFGPELNIFFPKPLFPFTLFYYKKDDKSKRIFSQPSTYLNMSVNYQSRQEYARTISSIGYGFRFKNYKGMLQYEVVPLEIYVVKAKLFGTFEQDLKNINDYFLLNSFRDHLTPLSRISVTYNNQSITKKRHYMYLKTTLSSSGNILRGIYNATGQPRDTAGRYNIYSIPFSQFVKINTDYRFYVKVRRQSKLVFRLAGGIGKPLANLNVLPYEQSFFSGGPNSVRAWRARTLGPGSYDGIDSTKDARYDKLGDIQLEGNFEYRFHIFKSVYGAWFVDAGNVWFLKPHVEKPNGDFQWNRFYKEFGVGSGFGIRYDFEFFVLRLDAAFKLYDPAYKEGNRWTYDKRPLNSTILNFGIGYPF